MAILLKDNVQLDVIRASSTTPGERFNAGEDMLATLNGDSGSEVWSYGYMDPQNSAFTPYSDAELLPRDSAFPFLRGWKLYSEGDGATLAVNATDTEQPIYTGLMKPQVGFMHPGPSGTLPTFRFTAPRDGDYTFSGFFQDLDVNGGSGAVGLITLDSDIELFRKEWGGGDSSEHPFSFSESLDAGDKVDIQIAMGSDYLYDSTAVAITITTDADTSDTLDIPSANKAPIASVARRQFLASQAAEPQSIQDWLQVTDANFEQPKLYSFRDSSADPNSGYFLYKKQIYQGKVLSRVPAKYLADVFYVPAASDSSVTREQISMQANDGKDWSQWSLPVTWSTRPNQSPEVTQGDQYFSARSWNDRIPVQTLFQASDPDAYPIESYNFWNQNKDGSGYFYYRGNVYQGELYGVAAKDLSRVFYVPGPAGSSEAVWIGATDGSANSLWAKAKWSTLQNQAPEASLAAYTFASQDSGQPQRISRLLSSSDPDRDLITSYRLVDYTPDPGSGYFLFQGTKYQGKTVNVSAEELSQLSFLPGKPGTKDIIGLTTSDGLDSSAESVASWQVSRPKASSYSGTLDLAIDKTFALGSLLNMPNEKTFNFFLGPDIDFSNKTLSPKVSGMGLTAGVKGSTGSSSLKAGLDISGGYSLGSLQIRGGATARLTYDEKQGLTLASTWIDPELNLETPYAYLKADLVSQIAFNPTLSAYWDAGALGSGKYAVPLPSVNLDKTVNLINLDSRSITGDGSRSQAISLGSVTTTFHLPEFNLPNQLPDVPSSLEADPKWAEGLGEPVTYGYQGISSLLGCKFSLSDLLSSLPPPINVPLSFSANLFGGGLNINLSLLAAQIEVQSELHYAATVSAKPNIYISVEGSNKHYPLTPNFSIPALEIGDVNGDRQLAITVAADPIIGLQASARVASNLKGSVDGLSGAANVKIGGFEKGFHIGPIFASGDLPLGSLADIKLWDQTAVFKLSDLFPDLQSTLTAQLNLPLS